MTEEIKAALATRGFAVERRCKSDASLSVGRVRLRLPQWAFWIGMMVAVSLLMAIVAWATVSIVSIRHGGKAIPIKGIVETRGYHSRTNAP